MQVVQLGNVLESAGTTYSGGYFYVSAYRYADLPEGHPTKGLERVIG